MKTQPKTYRKSTLPVLFLHDPATKELSVAGGKGANLAKLMEYGFSVPAGFCVTTAVYEELVDEPGIRRLVDELDDSDAGEVERLREVAAELRERIRRRRLSDSVLEAIEEAVNSDLRYVARSSATAEDLPTASFAGQHDTMLDVVGLTEVVDAVLRCMASVFTERAVFYRASAGISNDEVSMAVVIQKMVDPEVSGVLFSADPMSGRRGVMSIDAATGLGEAVVSGTVTAENIKVDRRTSEVISHRAEEGDGEMGRVLSEDEIRELVACGDRIEEAFGAPQDIEWSFVGGNLEVLQTRSITTLFPLPKPAPKGEGLRVYYSWNHRQGMTEVMPPLVVDYWLRSLNVLVERMGYHPGDAPGGATAGGMVYFDVTPLLRSEGVARRVYAGLTEFDPQAVADFEEICRRRRPEFAQISLLGSTSLARTLRSAGRLLPVVARSIYGVVHGAVSRSFKRAPLEGRIWADRLAAQIIDDVRSGATIEERLRIVLEKNDEFIWKAMEQALLLWNLYAYRAVLQRLCPGCDEEFAALERGLRENVTTAMMLELGDVTDSARDHPQLKEAIVEGADFAEVREVRGAQDFVEGVDNFIERYGFRAPAEIEFSKPRYREDPSTLMGTIRGSLQSAEGGDHHRHISRLEEEAMEGIARLEDVAEQGLFGALKRRLIRPFALRYRSFLSLREVTKYALAQLLAEVRRQVMDAAEMLVRKGRLEEASDVWLYGFDELIAAMEEPGRAPEVDIHARRAEFRWHRQLHSPRVITSDGEIPHPSLEEGVDGLVGAPTSRGVAEGIARVIYDPGGASLEKGEILVAPHTDPGWTPLFLNAVGLVTNVGGEMTHGSLVAREYGIPSVVIAEATQPLESGQRIRVDGYRGTVEIMDLDKEST